MGIGTSLAPVAASGLAVALLGVGLDGWLAAPLGAATALGGTWAVLRARRRRQQAAGARVAALRRALQRRDDHRAATGHDLRTPLAGLVAALELLRGQWASPGRETDEVLADAALAADHLDAVVADVLDEGALAAGRLRLRLASQPVAALLDDALRLLRLAAERQGVRLAPAAVDPRLCVRADAQRFRQIVVNLVGNALKAAPAGSAVQLAVQADAHRVRFSVLDGGPGVDDEVRQRLFAPFVTGARAPGTGLGLFVSMRLVQQMGGAIGHRAPGHGGEGRGAEFWFELPRALPPRERNDVAQPAGAAR